MTTPLATACPRCGGPRGWGRFCRSCGLLLPFPDADIYAAGRLRRLAGHLLESLLIAGLLGVGWLIWLWFVAPRSQSPAKSLLNMYILTEDGHPAGARRVWVREVVVQVIGFGFLGWLSGGVANAADALWILFDPDRQTLHDKVADTLVVRAAHGIQALRGGGTGAFRGVFAEKLRDLGRLREAGLITPEEYERRRRRLIDLR